MTEGKSCSDAHIFKNETDDNADTHEPQNAPDSIKHRAVDQGEKQRWENVQHNHRKHGHLARKDLQKPGRGVDSDEQPEREG